MGQCMPAGLKLKAIKSRRASKKGSKKGGVAMDVRKVAHVAAQVPTPVLEGESALISASDLAWLAANSPHRDTTLYRDEAPVWKRLFSLATHGRSFEQLRHALLAEGPTLVVVETAEGQVFGGFTDTWLEITDAYYGCPLTCSVFSLRPGTPTLYEPTYANTNMQYLNLGYEKLGVYGGMAMGGQHGFYTWSIDQGLESGQCAGNPSSTFGNPLLSGGRGDSERFALRALEVYRVSDPPADDHLAHLRLAKAENQLSILELYKEQFGNITGKTFFSDNLAPPVREKGWTGKFDHEPEVPAPAPEAAAAPAAAAAAPAEEKKKKSSKKSSRHAKECDEKHCHKPSSSHHSSRSKKSSRRAGHSHHAKESECHTVIATVTPQEQQQVEKKRTHHHVCRRHSTMSQPAQVADLGRTPQLICA